MHRLLLILMLASGMIDAAGQPGHFQIRTIREGEYLRFPIIEHAADTAVQQRINDFMQLAILQKLIQAGHGSAFREAAHDPGTIYGGMVSIQYKVTCNTSRILSIVFDLASSGATMHYWRAHLIFNSATGEVIHADDLFTAKGREQFMRRAGKRMVVRADACLSGVDTAERKWLTGWYDPITAYDLRSLYLRNGRLHVDRFNHLTKNEKFACEGEPVISYSAVELQPYLTAYGKAVLGLSTGTIAAFRSNSLPQLWSGCVDDRYPILFILRPDPEEWHGVYCYTRYGLGIDLLGKEVNGSLLLAERDRELDDRAEISGTLDDTGFMGSWFKLPDGKDLSFEAWPMIAGAR